MNSTPDGSGDSRPLRVFVVDDHHDVADGLADVIRMHGHEVVVANNGEQAIRIFKEQDFDIAFMDVMMPGMNGVESFLEIRKIKPDAKVIMMTGYSVPQLLSHAIENGAYGVLQKPVTVDQVMEALARVKSHGMVLVADDDPDFADNIKEVLEFSGYRVCMARTGKQALNTVLDGGIDILILDLQLPVINGIEVYMSLQKRGRAIPTVVVTGYSESHVKELGDFRDVGATGILTKPFDGNQLLEALNNVATPSSQEVLPTAPAAPAKPAAPAAPAAKKPDDGKAAAAKTEAKPAADKAPAKPATAPKATASTPKPEAEAAKPAADTKPAAATKPKAPAKPAQLAKPEKPLSLPAPDAKAEEKPAAKPAPPAKEAAAKADVPPAKADKPTPKADAPPAKPATPEPVAKDPSKLVEAVRAVQAELAAQEPPAASESPAAEGRVLAIDDDVDMVEGLAEVVATWGYTVRTANDAEAAEKVIQDFDAEVVLLDIRLGKTNGLDLIPMLREYRPGIFVVVITGNADKESVITALRNGANDYMTKPLRLEDLGPVLERCVKKYRLKNDSSASFYSIQQAKNRVEAANRGKAEFLMEASKALDKTMTAIVAATDSLVGEKHGPLGAPDYKRQAEIAHRHARNLQGIVNYTRDMSEADIGDMELSEEEVDVAALVKKSVKAVSDGRKADAPEIKVELPEDNLTFWGDERQLERMLLNLLDNAIKFTPDDGNVTVKARRNDDGELVLEVIDTGIGIAKKDIAKALTPFNPIDAPACRDQQGLGLGLPLVVAMAERHGGKVILNSVLGRGTTANVTFPAGRLVKSRSAA